MLQTIGLAHSYRQRDAQDGNDDEVAQRVAAFTQQFITAMDDDINVQNGIATVYELVKYANVYAQKPVVKAEALKTIKQELETLLGIFGVRLETSNCEIDDQAIKDLISKRNQARAAKNFALSDQIRDELKAQGIILEDTPQGTRYRKE